MAGSFDDLIGFLLGEIALCGDQGASTSDLKKYIRDFYEAQYLPEDRRRRNSDQDATSITSHVKPTIDRSLEEAVWKWLSAHPDVRVGRKKEGNQLTLAQVENIEASEIHTREQHNQTSFIDPQHTTRRGSATKNIENNQISHVTQGNLQSQTRRDAENAHNILQGLTSSAANNHSLEAVETNHSICGLRIYADQERMWLALAGHGYDLTKISRLEFELLSLIAKHGEVGILQPDLTRLSGQDKRSVPKRTEKLQKRGYIQKRAVSARGLATSLCVHRRFIGRSPGNEQVQDDAVAATGSIIVEGKEIFRDGVILNDNLLDVVFQLLQKHGMITQGDFRRKMGVEGRRWESKTFFRYIRRLEAVGCVQRVKARGLGSSRTFKCIKLLRIPTDRDRQLTKAFLPRGVATDDETLDVDAEGDDDDDVAAEDVHDDHAPELVHHPIQEVPRIPPQWMPDQPLYNLLFSTIHNGGKQGISTMDIKSRGLGTFCGRPLDACLGYLTDNWQLSQPPHLRHLGIVKDTHMLNKVAHYHYRTYPNFEAAVEAEEAVWEAVCTPHKQSAKQSSQSGNAVRFDELDEWGFPKLTANRFLGRAGTATIAECSNAVKDRSTSSFSSITTYPWDSTDRVLQATERESPASSGFLTSKRQNRNEVILPLAKRGRPRKYPKGQEPYISGNLNVTRRNVLELEQWERAVRRHAENITRDEIRAAHKRTAKEAGLDQDSQQGDAAQNLLDVIMDAHPELARHTETVGTFTESVRPTRVAVNANSLFNRQRVALGLPPKLGRPSKKDKLELESAAKEAGVDLDQLDKAHAILGSDEATMERLEPGTVVHSHITAAADVAKDISASVTASCASLRTSGRKRRKTQKLRDANDNPIELPEDRVQELVAEIKEMSRPGLYINPPHAKPTISGRPRKQVLVLVFKLPALKSLHWFIADASISTRARNATLRSMGMPSEQYERSIVRNELLNEVQPLQTGDRTNGGEDRLEVARKETTLLSSEFAETQRETSPGSMQTAKDLSLVVHNVPARLNPRVNLSSHGYSFTESSAPEATQSSSFRGLTAYGHFAPSTSVPQTYQSPYAPMEVTASSPYASTSARPRCSTNELLKRAHAQTEAVPADSREASPTDRLRTRKLAQASCSPGTLEQMAKLRLPNISDADPYTNHEHPPRRTLQNSPPRDFFTSRESQGNSEELHRRGVSQIADDVLVSRTPDQPLATVVTNMLISRSRSGEQTIQIEAMRQGLASSEHGGRTSKQGDINVSLEAQELSTKNSHDTQVNVHTPISAAIPVLETQTKGDNTNAPRTQGVDLTGGILGYQRNRIIMNLINCCGGVFPGGNEIWYPFVTAWGKLYKNQRPDRHTINRAIKNLVGSGKLRRASFAFQGKKGEIVTKSVLITASVAPDSESVMQMQKEIMDRHPLLYLPSQVEVSEGISMYEHKRIDERYIVRKDSQGKPEVVAETVERQYGSSTELENRQKRADAQAKRQAKEARREAQKERSEQRKKATLERRLQRLEEAEKKKMSKGQGDMQSNYKLNSYSHKPQRASNSLQVGRGVKRLHSLKGPTQRIPLVHRPLPTGPLQNKVSTLTISDSNDKGTGHLAALPSANGELDFDWWIDLDDDDDVIFHGQGQFRAFTDFGKNNGPPLMAAPLEGGLEYIEKRFIDSLDHQPSWSGTAPDSQVILPEAENEADQPMTRSGSLTEKEASGPKSRPRRRRARRQDLNQPVSFADVNAQPQSSQWRFVSETPLNYDPDYDKTQVSTLMDPDQTFYRSTGTFSTDFFVTRSTRQVVWTVPNPDAEFERMMPTCLDDIMNKPQAGRARDHAKWADPVYSQFDWEVQRVRLWEKSVCNQNVCGRSLRQLRFMCHSFPAAHQVPKDAKMGLLMWDHPASKLYSPFDPPPPDIAPVESATQEDIDDYGNALHPQKRRIIEEQGMPTSFRSLPQPPMVHFSESRESASDFLTASPTGTGNLDASTPFPMSSMNGTRMLVQAHQKRDRGRLTTSIASKDSVQKFIAAVVVTRTLTGGVRRMINWDAIMKLGLFDKEYEPSFLRRRWGHLLSDRKMQIQKMTVDFQEAFLKAYEEGTMPAIDYNNLDGYDWSTLIEWTMKNMEMPDVDLLPDLPPTRKELDENYFVKEITEFTDPALAKEELINTVTTLARREEVLADLSFSVPLDAHYSVTKQREENPEEQDEPLALAKTWIRANIATADNLYDSHAARDKLLPLGSPLIDRALASLLSSKVLRQENKGRLIPGRNYDITDSFLNSFRKSLEPSHFHSAAAYKRELDANFREQGYAMLGYHVKDGECAALWNLVASARVKIGPVLDRERFGRWGFVEGGYKTNKMDRGRLGFGVGIWPTETWVWGNPLLEKDGVPLSLPFPPAPHLNAADRILYGTGVDAGHAGVDGEVSMDDHGLLDGISVPLAKQKIPIWYDIHGNFIQSAWEMVGAAVLSCAALRAGIGARDVVKSVKGSLGVWEVRLVLGWMERVAAVTRTSALGGGWRTGEWWWAIFGEGHVDSGS